MRTKILVLLAAIIAACLGIHDRPTVANTLTCIVLVAGVAGSRLLARHIRVATPMAIAVCLAGGCGSQPQTSPTNVGNIIILGGDGIRGVDSSGDQRASSKQEPQVTTTLQPPTPPK